jgi:hypothetical protein
MATDFVFVAFCVLTSWFSVPVLVFLSVKLGRLGWLVANLEFERKFKKEV